MKFCWVTLPVKDLEKSLHFYHEILGLKIHHRQDGPMVSLVMLGDHEQPKIELIQGSNRKDQAFSSDITIGFEVKSLDEALEYMKSHQIKVSRGPIAPNPHIRFAYVIDPDGYEVQLVENN